MWESSQDATLNQFDYLVLDLSSHTEHSTVTNKDITDNTLLARDLHRQKLHKTEERCISVNNVDFLQVASHSENETKESTWWQHGVTFWYYHPIQRSKGINRKSIRVSNQSRLKQHLPFLGNCFKSNGKQQKEMKTYANKGQMEAIGDIALNLLKGNIVIPNSSFKRLKPHKSKLLYLTRKKPSL